MSGDAVKAKRHHIKTMQDAVDKLTDPATRDNFRKDFERWIEVVCERAEEVERMAAKAEGMTGKRFVMRQRAKFIWIDDGKHEETVDVRIATLGFPLDALKP